ncbi:hypothetical protein llap_4064 [Limosa lapponica baueri]|uniref:Uncharacterized protein n=1 Tax=Limosa lapponica baueri TaxID=1758121 RepID=A0A2I0UHX5_LIMLA|nr:hypothetical protein llap_4064 [Limosa lapponica baueri]
MERASHLLSTVLTLSREKRDCPSSEDETWKLGQNVGRKQKEEKMKIVQGAPHTFLDMTASEEPGQIIGIINSKSDIWAG